MTESTITIILFGCGTAAMWLCERDGRSDNVLSLMLFLFGPLSLAFACLVRNERSTGPQSLDIARLALTALYGIAFAQWMSRP
ncbi:MAG: hypothetical protein K2W81_10230 [Sphingomonas sp.]|uniref:hypothetical protein n=1 Tax=Sphingomonas sp. TaxID=28214 RepID=UPI0025E0A9F3|nr:hypothetical protein [Sphingomonas sp.]MBY0284327.1 hypothetical protein [Sphingomonas sp.]